MTNPAGGATAPARGDLLASLLAKHLRATGASAAPADHATHEYMYTVSAAGLTGSMVLYEAPPHKSRAEFTLGPLHEIVADDGTTFWKQDSTGNVRIVRGEEMAQARADSGFSLESYDPLKNSTLGKVTLRPQREAGTGCFILDVAPQGGTRQSVYLDPQTYLVRKIVARKGGLESTVSVLAYRTVNHIKMPARLEMGMAGLPLSVTAELTEIRRAVVLSAALFQPPHVAQDYEFLAADGKGPVSIPFSDAGNQVIVPVSINGHALRFLLDSGAGNSFITSSAASALGLITEGDLPSIGYGGSAKTGIATRATIEIPNAVRLHGQVLYVIEDPQVTQALTGRLHVDGGLGYDLLTRFLTTIDYSQKMLTLADPATTLAAPPAGGKTVSLPLNLEARTPIVRAAVDGKTPGQFLLDTGDSGAVHLYSQYARANGLLPRAQDPHAQAVTGFGIGGNVSEMVTPGHRLSLGDFQLSDVPVATISGAGISDVSAYAGGIGGLALKKFVVTFDYARQRLLLRHEADWTSSVQPDGPVPTAPPAATTPIPQPVPAVQPAPITQPAPAVQPAPITQPAPAPGASAGLTLDQVLQKHLEALGGLAAVAAIRTTRVTATVRTGGIQGRIVNVFSLPDREYEQDQIGLLTFTQGYDGKDGWRRDGNGNVRPLGSDETRTLRNQIYYDTYSYVVPGRLPGKVSLRPQAEAGTGNYILDVQPEGGKPGILYIDPKSFMLVKEQHLEDNILETTTFSAFRTYDGVRVPTHFDTTNGTARYDSAVTADRIENNIPVPPSTFARPTAGHKFAFIKPGTTSATVPFDLDDGEIGLAVLINGQRTRVFLDSGASGLALAQTTADTLHLKHAGYMEARGYGGSADLHPVQITTFEVPGAVRLSDITAVAIPLPRGFDQSLSRPVDGFVGYDLLSHFVVRIDYARRLLTFLNPAAFHPGPADGKEVPIELDNDIPSITAQVDALPPNRFLLDTGDEAALRLYGPYVDQNKLSQKYPKGIPSYGGGIGGLSSAQLTRIDHFSVAGVTLHGVPAEFSLDKLGGASQVNAGSLGSSLLSRFVVTFDYTRGRVFFAPNADAGRPFDTRTRGITVMPTPDKKHLIVSGVEPGAPVAADGLAAYDEILQIDGTPVNRLGLPLARRLLSGEGGPDTRLLLVRSSDGRTRTFHARLFDPLP